MQKLVLERFRDLAKEGRGATRTLAEPHHSPWFAYHVRSLVSILQGLLSAWKVNMKLSVLHTRHPSTEDMEADLELKAHC